MSGLLGNSPQVLAFLQDAHERPGDDTPRLVLADYLEDHGDPDRAEFIRLQCRLAAGQVPLEEPQREQMEGRCRHLQDRRGGCWLGRLWRWPSTSMSWHRGLLSLRLPRRFDFAALEDAPPWIDSAHFALYGRGGLQRVVDLMSQSRLNHVYLDLRAQMGEGTLRTLLADIPESASLRSLSIHWPLALLRRRVGIGEGPFAGAAVSEEFFAALLGELPVGRHLTHLGTSRPFSPAQAQVIRAQGVEPVHAQDRLWMHRLPPTVFQASRAVRLTSSQSRTDHADLAYRSRAGEEMHDSRTS